MQTYVNVGWSQEFKLKQALLLYGESSYNVYPHRHPFATLHDVIHEEGDVRLAAAQLLTPQALYQLLCEISPPPPIEVLPECVLARSSDTVVWWSPAKSRKMFFQERAKAKILGQLNGKSYPHPPLLFKADEKHLWVRALAHNRRPTADTKTCMAPYWNCYDNASVCTGSMRLPTQKSVAAIYDWEKSFFDSAFSHAAGVTKHTSHPAGVLGLWKSLQGQERFPTRYLIPMDETLEQFVTSHDTFYRNRHRA